MRSTALGRGHLSSTFVVTHVYSLIWKIFELQSFFIKSYHSSEKCHFLQFLNLNRVFLKNFPYNELIVVHKRFGEMFQLPKKLYRVKNDQLVKKLC